MAPRLLRGENVLVTAHGNSLRAMVKMLDHMSERDILEFNIPTGIPMLYTLDAHLQPLKREYLADQTAIRKAAEAVAQQGKAK